MSATKSRATGYGLLMAKQVGDYIRLWTVGGKPSSLERCRSLNVNRLRNISRATFRGLIKLQDLYLSNNTFESIDDGVFEVVTNLTKLYLSNNQLRNISRATFRGLIKLQYLEREREIEERRERVRDSESALRSRDSRDIEIVETR
ncbi:hypothetical protein DPMN_002327 [Dreissena polymorpha]|uniref:Uncharacterized protein n=1 Tax=Dreissena polymorpha TaxID=45954 RepID=A0A9D4MM28_DREPO|nr:hypothetical protein DPMN_002327 [Dreissena polymorpha]